MEQLQNIVKSLIEKNEVQVFIGYSKYGENNRRPVFILRPDDASKLVWDDLCKQNLTVYLHKSDIKSLGKIGILANPPAIRTILQLASEHQLIEDQIKVFTVTNDGKAVELSKFADMENYVKDFPNQVPPPARTRVTEITEMPLDTRWNFWMNELSSCIKCYACRSACPLCYCTQCAVECNQPQWVSVPMNSLGNFEWHVMRAMHLAGRCISCGECVRACPMEIPLTLMTARLNEGILTEFGQTAGMKASSEYAMSSYKPDDKEHFIR